MKKIFSLLPLMALFLVSCGNTPVPVTSSIPGGSSSTTEPTTSDDPTTSEEDDKPQVSFISVKYFDDEREFSPTYSLSSVYISGKGETKGIVAKAYVDNEEDFPGWTDPDDPDLTIDCTKYTLISNTNQQGNEIISFETEYDDFGYLGCIMTALNPGTATLRVYSAARPSFYTDLPVKVNRTPETINEVKEKPSKVAYSSELGTNTLKLEVAFDDTSVETVNPTEVVLDTSKIGENVTGTAKYYGLEKEFTTEVYDAKIHEGIFNDRNFNDDFALFEVDSRGYAFNTERGVQISKSVSGAGAHTKDEFSNISQIDVYLNKTAEAKGYVEVFVGNKPIGTIDASEMNTTTTKAHTLQVNNLSGKVNFKITVTEGSLYIPQINWFNPRTINGITLLKNPTKTSYVVGEEFSTKGMVLVPTYKDGSVGEAKDQIVDYTISPDRPLTETDENVRISYKTYFVDIPVTVEKIAVESIELYYDSASIVNHNIEFDMGEGTKDIELVALVKPQTASYKDVTFTITSDVNELILSQDDNKFTLDLTKTGLATITVTSNDDPTITEYTNIQIIDRSLPVLTGITVTGTCVKTVQYTDDQFDPEGLTFTPVYNKQNDNPETIIVSDIAWNKLVAGQAVTGTYKGILVTVTTEQVTIVDDQVSSLSFEGDMTKKTYVDFKEQWDVTGLTVNANMISTKTKDVTDSVEFTFDPEVPAIGVTEVTVTATLGTVQESKTVTGITVNAYVASGRVRITRSNFKDGALGYGTVDNATIACPNDDSFDFQMDAYSTSTQNTLQTKFQVGEGQAACYPHNTTKLPYALTNITIKVADTSVATLNVYGSSTSVVESASNKIGAFTLNKTAGVYSLDINIESNIRFFCLIASATSTSIQFDYIQLEYGEVSAPSPVSITSVLESPKSVFQGDTIAVTDVKLDVMYDDGFNREINPTSITADTSTIGTVTGYAYVEGITEPKEFNYEVVAKEKALVYNKVATTDTLTSGTYIILAENGGKSYTFNNKASSASVLNTSLQLPVNPVSNVLTLTADASYKVTITVDASSHFELQIGTIKLYGPKSSGGNFTFTANTGYWSLENGYIYYTYEDTTTLKTALLLKRDTNNIKTYASTNAGSSSYAAMTLYKLAA